MNKGELVTAVAEKSDISKAQAEKALDSIMTNITSALVAGDSVALIGFGTFAVKTRAARTGRNPQTGAELQIAEAKVPSFKAGTKLKSAVN